ncbi:hypothetical protein ACFQ15_05820 [Sphingomonas hankookensis]|uniref:hypothetical protein n=1 Tax=Sphingomonas hankookensis TaxID=563996 RepID=UPI001F55EE4D|nr:hypothetical protein [Sphingomonas hankookensis]
MAFAPSDALDGSPVAHKVTTADGQRGKIPVVALADADGKPTATKADGFSRSGSIATGGQAQPLAPANPARRSLRGVNRSTGILYINEVGGTASPADADSYPIGPSGGGFDVDTNRAVSVWGATTGQAWTATET